MLYRSHNKRPLSTIIIFQNSKILTDVALTLRDFSFKCSQNKFKLNTYNDSNMHLHLQLSIELMMDIRI